MNEHWTNFQESFYVVPSDHVAITSSLTLLYFLISKDGLQYQIKKKFSQL